ncbi:FAD/NAD(P)-binding protein [Lacticaseibacillus suibinensis]|uniref:FAD/NAD(P)-binding protein n=1 Tax=Lacticaseibacillus suibinensis TaxID=2486011 RepID=UPI001944E55C|nr:FAD/NAD(P)-binding protein [Lacticaseibacillus suibinensis]
MKVALIGAGPRGLLVLERLIAWQQQMSALPLTITLFDPYPIGGRVWRRDQAPQLIMNTAAQHITLFYDRTVQEPGPIMPGPSLAQWAVKEAATFLRSRGKSARPYLAEAATLGPNDYPSRALYGYYLAWFYAEMHRRKRPNVALVFKQTMVQAVSPDPFTVHTAAGAECFDAVVLALGTMPNSLTREQAAFTAFAKAHQRVYLPPSFPAEGDLSRLGPQDVVAMRGLGLSFFDYVSRLTEGRGGHFRNEQGQLTYQASGAEPHIIAGSRRGLPYHAKARNEKAPGEAWPPRFLTAQQLANWAASGPITGKQFFQGLKTEVGFVYYSLLLAQQHPEVDLPSFQADYMTDPAEALAALKLPAAELLDWTALTTPPQGDDPKAMLIYLAKDAAEAERGSKTGPLTSALEVLRDLRDTIRQVVDLGLLTDDEYLDFFLRWFNGTNDFLSIGPPVIRIEQLRALIAAGIVTIAPPQITIATAGTDFIVRSQAAEFERHATALIEARVPAPNAGAAQNPLMQQLLHDGLATLMELQLAGDRRFQSGAVLVDRHSAQLLDQKRRTQGKFFFWGVPTEGLNWLTTASPRPFSDDVNLRLANRIARQILD